MSDRAEDLTPEEKANRRGWLPAPYELILCPQCGSGCCYCGIADFPIRPQETDL